MSCSIFTTRQPCVLVVIHLFVIFNSAVFLLLHICMYVQRWQFLVFLHVLAVIGVFSAPTDFHGCVGWASVGFYAGADSRVIFTSAFSQCFLLYQILVFVHAALALADPFSVVLHIHMFLHAVRALDRFYTAADFILLLWLILVLYIELFSAFVSAATVSPV